MTFENHKRVVLSKRDKSSKQAIDTRIKIIVDDLNSMDDYYTTSSCSGRIVLYNFKHKKEHKWLFVSHDPVEKSIYDIIESSKESNIGFRCEPMILHVNCRDMDSAGKLINFSTRAGLRAGIISLASKIIVEIQSTEFMDLPVKIDEVITISSDHFDKVLTIANKKIKLNYKKIVKFHDTLVEF